MPRAWTGSAARAFGLAAMAAGLLVAAAARAETDVPTPAAGRRVRVGEPGCETALIVLNDRQLVFGLPHGFIRPGSDSVWTSRGAWARGKDYDIDWTLGELRLYRVPIAGDSVWVRTCRLVGPPPLLLQHRAYHPLSTPSETTSARSVAPPPLRPATARDVTSSGATLQLSGNKTVAVDFGSSQDATLRQSLDLTVSGKLSSDVELAAVLSDRNTPLSVLGASQDIQSLDRVLLEVRSPHGGASLGDITLDLKQGEFGLLSRRLQGARGSWTTNGVTVQAAASTTQGTYRSIQFFGQDGLQGPYQLSDGDGHTGVPVVALSEKVVVDGVKMSRGESADYAMDYDRGTITFTNRRPISSASRIAIDYQYSLDRFRRNLAAAGLGFERGGFGFFTQFVTEADDRGQPIGPGLSESDRLALAMAGDSSSAALGPGVTPGPGDYDLVRRDANTGYFAFAGIDSGDFAVSFALVGNGRGEYVDSVRVGSRTIYRYVGPGLGSYRVGRQLPLPQSHQLWTLGTSVRAGGMLMEGEGAVSRLDLNTFSSLDDGHNVGKAGRVHAAWNGALPSPGGHRLGTIGFSALYRALDPVFQPFARLEAPFAEEDWGLPLGVDMDHQERTQFDMSLRPAAGGELAGGVSRLRLPGGYDATREGATWTSDGHLAARARWDRSAGVQPGVRFEDGGREKRAGELRWRGRWLEPAVHADWDERRSPSDTGRVGSRYRLWGADLKTTAWKSLTLRIGQEMRHDDQLAGESFAEQFASQTYSAGVDAQGGSGVLGSFGWQRRIRTPHAQPERMRTDLGYSRLQLATPERHATGDLSVEVTSEAQSRSLRELRYVGGGLGAYDSLGNYVGKGDYNVVITIGPDAERVARGVVSAHALWEWGGEGVWRASRLIVDAESEARRPGALTGGQLFVTPDRVWSDADFISASALWRVDQEVAPDSPLGGLRLLLERRGTADRTYVNFAQATDQRLGSLRWRARPGNGATVELEGRLKRQQANTATAGSIAQSFSRALDERGLTVTGTRASNGRWSLGLSGDGAWTTSPGLPASLVLKAGPDAWLAFGPRGRLDLSARRAWLHGNAPPAVLPTAVFSTFSVWEGTVRLDYHLPPWTNISTSLTGRTHEGQNPEVVGSAEVRVFF